MNAVICRTNMSQLPSFLTGAIVAAAVANQATAHPHLNSMRTTNGIPFTNASLPVKSLGTMTVSSPGFAAVLPQNDSPNLFISSFHPFGSDSVYRIPSAASLPANGLSSNTPIERVPGSITWPNDITYAPASVFGTDGVLVGGGFLVPGKSDGGLYYSPNTDSGSSGKWVEIASAGQGWFYHRALLADIDNDGHQEIVSCRATRPLFGSTGTMLVTLKPSDPSNPQGAWTETELGPGCDALFTVADLDGDGKPEVIAASYFTSQLNLFHSKASTGFANPTDVQVVTLDATVGAAFDVQVVDVNGDGKVDLLVSNHQGDGATDPSGGVYAYEITTWKSILDPSAYVRHTLADGFPVTQPGFNQASPGSAIAFHPTPGSVQGAAAYIALAGDAAQIAYVLVPVPGQEWGYTVTELHDCGCTVGKLAVGDVDGDGYQEVFVPCYDSGRLAGYSFKA